MPNLTYDVYEGASDKNLQFLIESVHGFSTFLEALDNTSLKKSKNKKVFDNLNGKGEKLADNIVERALSVSTELLNDEEFINFSKKNNPELLKKVKEFDRMASNRKKNA